METTEQLALRVAQQSQPYEIDQMAIDAGGKFHGPIVEHLSISQENYRVLAKLLIEHGAKAFLSELAKQQEPVAIEAPDYHDEAMGCGLEDRSITDRYEAMRYGWECAVERIFSQIPDEPLYAGPAIPQPAAVPDGWRDTIKEAERLLQAWADEDGCECEGSHYCGRPKLMACIAGLRSMLSAAPVPPHRGEDGGEWTGPKTYECQPVPPSQEAKDAERYREEKP